MNLGAEAPGTAGILPAFLNARRIPISSIFRTPSGKKSFTPRRNERHAERQQQADGVATVAPLREIPISLIFRTPQLKLRGLQGAGNVWGGGGFVGAGVCFAAAAIAE
ncbi:hypothetical protein Ga0100231_005875 [Opitutaceae bacterium TAV4]|nr:hypothetical protein Ga0100231_005875 [Opitutaceae bacterium TAV4]RRK02504.1 hypothetical protein Ga0100230_005085 [Opitutaceae bacterium TAV3]